MANLQHLERLQRGVQQWNQWRSKHPGIIPDLSGASLRAAQLSGVNLSGAKLRRIHLDRAELSGANLYKADLSGADLCEADLSGVKLRKARLRGIRLSRTDLRGANLSKANLPESDLSGANLTGANLTGANLCRANLSGANLSNANLRNAWLVDTQIPGTVFIKAMFTGACIQGWNPNSTTLLAGVICEYVYLKDFQKDRYPKDRSFKPDEFATAFQNTSGIINLVFRGHIDWQAFCQSFQVLGQQYADANLSIQAIEKRQGSAFVIRVEMSPETDATVIEHRAKEIYTTQVRALDAKYKQRLRSQGDSFGTARHSINRERRDKATLMGVLTTMAHSQQGPKYRTSNTPLFKNFTKTARHHSNGKHSVARSSKQASVTQAKIIEQLLSGKSLTTINQTMQLKPGQLRFYQQQLPFRTAYWQAFLHHTLKLVRTLMTLLKKLAIDPQINSKYSLWLINWWLDQFFATLGDQTPPNIPVLQSEIIHLFLFGMTRQEVSHALMIDSKQINKYRQQPAFRVAFWYAYCQKLSILITKATDVAKGLMTNRQISAHYCLMAVGYLLNTFPTDCTRTLQRIELEHMACTLMAIGAGPIAYAAKA